MFEIANEVLFVCFFNTLNGTHWLVFFILYFTEASSLALVYSCESNKQLILLPAQRRTTAQWAVERARNTQYTGLGHFRLNLSIIEVEKKSTKIKTRNKTIKTKHTSTLGFAAASVFV